VRQIKKGATSQSVYLIALDSASTTGGRKTGIVFNSAGLTAYYARNQAAATAITLATLATPSTAWSSGGFVEVDATNMPGLYRLDIPDAAVASGADSVVVTVKGATGMVQADIEVQLTGVDLMDAVRGGMTALPNAAAEAAGGLYTRGSGAGQINQPANGLIDANVTRFGGTAGTFSAGRPEVNTTHLAGTSQTARDIGASVLLSTGTGTGQLDFTSGVVKANLAQILGTALTETAGQIAAGFKKFFNVASPTAQADNLPLNTDYTSARATKLDNLDATVSSRMATFTLPTNFSALAITAGGAVTAGTVSDKTGYSLTQSFPTNFSTLAIDGSGQVTVGINNDKTAYQLTTGNQILIAGRVWDELIASHSTAGTTGLALASASSAGDPWGTALPGAYASGTAGFLVGTYVNASISAVKAKTDNLPAAPAAVSDIPTANTVRDAVFNRTFSAAYGGYSFDELTKQFSSVLLGKASGLDTTTAKYRNLADSADVITATVDANGNRTAVTRAP
jgi:hypothetical protein